MTDSSGCFLFSGFNDSYLLDVFSRLDTEKKLLLLPGKQEHEPGRKYTVNFDLLFNFNIEAVITQYESQLNNFVDEHSYFEIYPSFFECRYYFDKTLDRLLLEPVSARARDKYFKILVMQSIVFLEKYSIKSVFFHATPHFPAELCLFFTARYLSIDTYITKRTLIDNTIFISSDFRRIEDTLISFANEGEMTLSLDKCMRSTWLDYSKSVISKVSTYSSGVNFLKFCRTSLSALLGREIKIWYYNLGIYKTIYYLSRRFREINANQKTYKKLCLKNIDYEKPYLVFFLQFQPERTTQPEAEYFDNQFELINLISSALPDNYLLYVKEHPRQDVDLIDFRQLGIRKPGDYEQIATLSNVLLVDKSVSSKKLIQNSQLVLSCNGSSLWEGLIYGIPGLSFAQTWHSACQSTPCYDKNKSLESTIGEILDQSSQEIESNLKAFLTEFGKYAIDSINLGIFASKEPGLRLEQINNYSAALNIIIRKADLSLNTSHGL
jgi:hypothetical protein